MSSQIQITGETKVKSLTGVLVGTSGVVSSLNIDGSLGIPQLDVNGKILVSQLPNSVMEYKGTWDASTNTPTLVNGTGNQGDVYLCSVAGTVNFGAGAISFVVSDQVIYSGSIWQKASGTNGTVTSVAVTETGDSLNITGSPITTSGTINIGFNGTNLQYINGAGNLTTFPALTGYVPYTGATQDVDLGAFKLNAQSLHAKGTGGLGHLGLKHQSASATASANEVSLFADSLGDISWQNGNLYLSKFITSGNTANRSYTFPNANGTVALTSDISYPVTSVFGRTGAVVATSGDYTTTQVTEGTNLYYTDVRARASLSFVAGSGAYNSTTGVITIPTNNTQITNGSNYITLASLSAGTGISYNNTTGVITNSLPDQTVALTASTGISVTGTYPNFTITNTSPSSGGTVTSVAALTLGTSGTDLSSTVATSTTTPVITLNVPTASATNRGALSSADWSTFNGKESVLTFSSPLVRTTNTISIPVATTSVNGYLSSTDWTTFNNKQNALTNPVTATGGAIGQVAFFTGTNTIDGESNLLWDASNNRLQVGSVSSTYSITALDGLQVGDGSGSAINFNSASGYQAYIRVAGNDRIVINSTSGRVGINTTNVNASLEVKSTTANEGSLRLYNTINNAATAWGLEWFRDYDSGSNSSAAYIKYNREGGSSGALIFGVGSVGSIATAVTINSSKAVVFESSIQTNKIKLIDSTSSTNYTLYTGVNNVNSIGFYNETTASYNLVINPTGNIGVGTISPNYTATGRVTVDINGSSTSMLVLSSGGTAKTYLYNNGTTTTLNAIAGSLYFQTTGSDRMTIDSSTGFVGINNTTPFARLTIDANIGSSRSFSSSSIPNIFLRDTTTSGINVGGAITFAGYKSTANATGLFAVISGQKENGINTDEKGAFVVYTSYTAGGAFQESFRVKSNGVLNSSNYGGGGNRVIYTDNAGDYIAATVGTGLSLSGGVLSATGGGSGTVSGTGNSGYIAKWSGTSAIANSNIYDDGTNVIVAGTTATVGFRFTALSTTANNTTAIPTWPYYDMGSQTMTRKIASFTDGGNGGTSTAGTGTTALIEIGQYYSGRGVIQMASSGGASPSDQGTGRGKDLLIIAGQSDNGAGYSGGRLYLQGGSGYSGGYNTNFGSVIINQLGGNVGVGSSALNYKLDVNGDIRAEGNLRATSSGSGLYLSGGSNRVYFTNYRAMEGDATGTLLQIGESYATTQIYSTLKIVGSSSDLPRLNMFGATYQIIGMGDRSSSTATDIGYMQIFSSNTVTMDFNGDSSGFSFINAGNLVIGSSSQIYGSAKLQVSGDLYVSGATIFAGGVTYGSTQTFNGLVYLNNTTQVANGQFLQFNDPTYGGFSIKTLGASGGGASIVGNMTLLGGIINTYGYTQTFNGNGSSAYNVVLSNSGIAADQLTMLGGLRLDTTTAGFIPPRMTTTQKNALPASVKIAGCIVYDTTSNLLQAYNGSTWNNLW